MALSGFAFDLSLLLFSLLWCSSVNVEGAYEPYHNVTVKSLLPLPYCVRHPNGPHKVEVRSRHGPCSPSGQKKKIPIPNKAFSEDKATGPEPRVTPPVLVSDTTSLLDNPSSGIFAATVRFGTPNAQKFELAVDTGSEYTWIPCTCWKKNMSCFNPQLSSSYSNRPCISSSNRTYEVSYADGSYSSGTYSCDTVTLDDVKTKIQFGCAQHFHGDFSNVDGMLGLGPGQFSFVSQIASKAFSYCLPSVGSFIGHLRFGNQATNAHKFTPLEIDSNYYVKVLEITVGRKKLKLPESMSSSPGAILDSGTTITRLPKSAYDDLKSAFRELMTSYTPAPPEDILDTCYYPTGLKNVMIPNIVMHFEGADVSLHPAGILWAVPKSPIKLCLAFAAKNSREGEKGPAIIGSTQQKTMDVLYDLERRTVGFAMNGCH